MKDEFEWGKKVKQRLMQANPNICIFCRKRPRLQHMVICHECSGKWDKWCNENDRVGNPKDFADWLLSSGKKAFIYR
jgi:hypothetical protein